jgi:hypothetical protein
LQLRRHDPVLRSCARRSSRRYYSASPLDPDGESLTAVLGTPPAHGTLTLNADGSFAYVPAPGFSGVDTFIYRAMDEVEALTDPTIVDITVQ